MCTFLFWYRPTDRHTDIVFFIGKLHFQKLYSLKLYVKDIQILPKCPRVCTSDAANAEILAFHNWFNAERDTFIAGTISYLAYLKNGSNQLIVTQYTLSIYPSLHYQLIWTLFKAHMVVNSIIKTLSACPMSTIMFFIIKDQGIFLLNNN